jgi:hypothetical protein
LENDETHLKRRIFESSQEHWLKGFGEMCSPLNPIVHQVDCVRPEVWFWSRKRGIEYLDAF